MLRFVAGEVRELMAERGIAKISDVVGRRDLLQRKAGLSGKAALLDLGVMLHAPHGNITRRRYRQQSMEHMPNLREREVELADAALSGESVVLSERLTNVDRCVGVGAAGTLARACGDLGLEKGSLRFEHRGAAGHFYAAYSVSGMEFRLTGLAADSCFTAAYGGKLVIAPEHPIPGLTVVGSSFGYGARGGEVFIGGMGGNRFGICLRKNHEGGGPTIVVEGVGCNAFQYMTGGCAVVLGPTGFNLGSGMTGGTVYLLDADLRMLNREYVQAVNLTDADAERVRSLVLQHRIETGSRIAESLLTEFDPNRFRKVITAKLPEALDPILLGLAVSPK
jgi:glutamate synthase domain-containing protein 3